VIDQAFMTLWWTPETGQFGGLDLLRAFPSDRSPVPGSIHLARGTVVQRLVGTLLVVEPEVGRQARRELRNTIIVLDVDIRTVA